MTSYFHQHSEKGLKWNILILWLTTFQPLFLFYKKKSPLLIIVVEHSVLLHSPETEGGCTFTSLLLDRSTCYFLSWLAGASLVAYIVKNLPVMWETWVWFLVWKDPLEKGMATHSSILAWRITWTKEPNRLCTVHAVIKNWTRLNNFHISWLAITTK